MNSINTLIGALDLEAKRLPHLLESVERIQKREADIYSRGSLERRVLCVLLNEEKEELSLHFLKILAFVKILLTKVPEKTERSDLRRLQGRALEVLTPVFQNLQILNPSWMSLLLEKMVIPRQS